MTCIMIGRSLRVITAREGEELPIRRVYLCSRFLTVSGSCSFFSLLSLGEMRVAARRTLAPLECVPSYLQSWNWASQ